MIAGYSKGKTLTPNGFLCVLPGVKYKLKAIEVSPVKIVSAPGF